MLRILSVGLLLALSATQLVAGANDFFSEHSKDFGTSPRGPVLTHYFTIKNTSKETVTLGTPRVSCGCVSPNLLKSQLAPGESTAIVAHMDTRRIPQAGVQRKVTIYVPFLTPRVEEVQLFVSAVVRDDLVMTPEIFSFGTLRKGEGGKVMTRVTFHGDPNWKIIDAASSGQYIQTEVKAQRAPNEALTSYEVTATLDPKCPVGNWTADVWLRTGTPGMEKIRIPATVNVVAPIAANPDFLRFDEVKAGSTTELKVILQGTKKFKITDVQSNSKGLEVDTPVDAEKPIHILNVKLTGGSEGDFKGKLTIQTTHPDQPTVDLEVSARVKK